VRHRAAPDRLCGIGDPRQPVLKGVSRWGLVTAIAVPGMKTSLKAMADVDWAGDLADRRRGGSFSQSPS